MKNLTLLSMTLSGCVRPWVHPENAAEQTQKDLYACMKENTFYGEETSAGSGRGGSRYGSSKGMKVQPQLLKACMGSKGYVKERQSPDTPMRIGGTSPPTFQLEVGATAGSTAVSSTYTNIGLAARDQVVSSSGHSTSSTFFVGGTAGIGIQLHEVFQLAPLVTLHRGRGVHRISDNETQVSLPDGYQELSNPQQIDADIGSPLAMRAELEARLGLPFYRRLALTGSAGVSGFARTPSITAVVNTRFFPDDDSDTVSDAVTLQATGRDRLWAPMFRLGLAWTPVYANPNGFRMQCAIQGNLVPGVERSDMGVDCGASWLFGLSK